MILYLREIWGAPTDLYVVKITTRTACKYGKAKNTRTTKFYKFYRNIFFNESSAHVENLEAC